MNSFTIRPGPVYGTVSAPPSKSYTHRALVVGHLAHRRFRVVRPLDSDDTRATAEAAATLGTPVRYGRNAWSLGPPSPESPGGSVLLRCGESGTTLRFFAALAGLGDRTVLLTGADRLAERPIDSLLDTMRSLGATSRHLRGKGFPLEVRGPMRGGRVSLDVSESSQFASALLVVLPTLEDDSSLELAGTVVSRPYIEATLAVLAHHGVRVERRGRRFLIAGGQRYQGTEFRVPGDASSAAYLWTAAAIAGGRVRVRGIPKAWPQADLAILDLLERTGAAVTRQPDGATVSGAARRPFRVDLTDAPDLYPLAGVLAATTSGVSRIVGAEHVVLKESDRKAGTGRLARRLGAKVETVPNGLRIEGTNQPKSLDLSDLTDHRLVMSAAVAALAGDGRSVVGDRRAVRKSFPGFWAALSSVSGGRSRA